MKTILLDVPTFGFIVATRALLGVGLGLLLAERLPASRRRAAGAVCLTLGVVATAPALIVLRRALHDDRLDA